ncbi:OmpA family protein [Azospirillum oleiclasticum]|nr:OmpA family protein [Azospirillum oleiclasticum]
MKRSTFVALFMGASLALGSVTAMAADAPPAATTADEFIRGLVAPPPAPGAGVRTRGIALGTGAAPAAPATATAPAATAPAARPRVRFQVEFAFNSAELSPRATQILNELGRALSSPDLSPFRFQLSGHTDATGRADYNVDLSRRRAQAVRDYLVQNFSIPAARLDTIGLGSQMLLDTANPASGVNRRVEITNLGS